MSMFLLQPPSATCQVTMLRAAFSASSLRPPLRRMIGAQRKHAAAQRRMLGIGIARGLLLIGERLLVDGLLSFRPVEIFEPRLLLLLRQRRNAFAGHWLGNHVHANLRWLNAAGDKIQSNNAARSQNEQESRL